LGVVDSQLADVTDLVMEIVVALFDRDCLGDVDSAVEIAIVLDG
jgi:hypothetical protein